MNGEFKKITTTNTDIIGNLSFSGTSNKFKFNDGLFWRTWSQGSS